MSIDLTQCHDHAWDCLEDAVQNTGSAFRQLTLCSLQDHDTESIPDARILVLRRAHRANYLLEFHTDIRSPKWQQLFDNPIVTVLGYDTQQQLQLRMPGTIALLSPDSTRNMQAWQSLAPWTKHTYCGPPPGSPVASPESGLVPLKESTVDSGSVNFGLIIFCATSLDYFQLQRSRNTRARLNYQSSPFTAQWVAP